MKLIVRREPVGVYRVVTADAARTEVGYFLSWAALRSQVSALPAEAPKGIGDLLPVFLSPTHPLLRQGAS